MSAHFGSCKYCPAVVCASEQRPYCQLSMIFGLDLLNNDLLGSSKSTLADGCGVLDYSSLEVFLNRSYA